MCYETTLTKEKELIEDYYRKSFAIPEEYEPYYHRSGFTHPNLQIIKMDELDRLYPARWGYVPSWGRDDIPAFQKKYNTLNIKSETLFQGLSKESASDKRCLILSDGFFEPHQRAGISIPYFCYIPSTDFADGRHLFAFGGIYSEIEREANLYSCSILTMPANDFFAEVHNRKKRQPLVLDEELYNEWLNPSLNKKDVLELMSNGFTSKNFRAHPVSRDIYNRGVDTNHPGILKEEQQPGLLF